MSTGTVEQPALLDLEGRELNIAFVDDNQPLFIANNPLHWKAHKLQVALDRMEKQQKTNPAQFNATVYFATIDKLGELMEQINAADKVAGKINEILDAGSMVTSGHGGAAPSNSEIKPISMDL